jgi:hypothetical protein
MKKTALLFLMLGLGFSFSTLAQDFTFDELLKLKTSNLSDFEDYVHAKGFTFINLNTGYENCVSFRKGDETITYCGKEEGKKESVAGNLIYDVTIKEKYETLAAQVKKLSVKESEVHLRDGEPDIIHTNVEGGFIVHMARHNNYKTHSHVYELELFSEETDEYQIHTRQKNNINFQ